MKLEELFDIAHGNALIMIRIQEDKDILIVQREKGRCGHIGNLDRKVSKAFAKKQRIREKRMLAREQEDVAYITKRK